MPSSIFCHKGLISYLLLAAGPTGAQINPNLLPPTTGCKQAYAIFEQNGQLQQGSHQHRINLDSAVQLCPEFADAWREASVAYLKRGDLVTWRRYMDRAVEVAPLDFLAIRGVCFYDFLRDYDHALADLTRLDTLRHFQPTFAFDYDIYYWMARCKQGQGDYAGALAYFNRSIDSLALRGRTGSVGLFSYLDRGQVKLALGDLPGALADFDAQINNYPNIADAWYYRGLALERQGNPDAARQQYQTALDLLRGKGYKRSDPYQEVAGEIYEETILEKLR